MTNTVILSLIINQTKKYNEINFYFICKISDDCFFFRARLLGYWAKSVCEIK